MYENNFDFDLLITCRPIINLALEIKTLKEDSYGRPYDCKTVWYLTKDELKSFILPKNHWIEDMKWCNVISVAPIK